MLTSSASTAGSPKNPYAATRLDWLLLRARPTCTPRTACHVPPLAGCVDTSFCRLASRPDSTPLLEAINSAITYETHELAESDTQGRPASPPSPPFPPLLLTSSVRGPTGLLRLLQGAVPDNCCSPTRFGDGSPRRLQGQA